MQQQVLGRRTRATFRGRGGWPMNTGTSANCPPERGVRQFVQFLWRNFPSHSVGSLCRSGASLWGNSYSEWVRKAKCYRKDDWLQPRTVHMAWEDRLVLQRRSPGSGPETALPPTFLKTLASHTLLRPHLLWTSMTQKIWGGTPLEIY